MEIAAVSDVDSEHLQNGMKELEALQESTSRAFKDYRDLLEMPGLEAVLIGTPTHWHALQFVDACKKGLHIYCEKPLAYDLEEGKAMVEAARKAGNIVQIGFQRRQSNAYKKAKELSSKTVLQVKFIKLMPKFTITPIKQIQPGRTRLLRWTGICGADRHPNSLIVLL